MKQFLIHFKVIDHYSDIAAPVERTIVRALNERDALDLFYTDMTGECVWLETVEEVDW